MVLPRSVTMAIVASAAACAPSLRVEPLPEGLAARDPVADAAAAFVNGDCRVLGYHTGFGALTPGVARSEAAWLNAHHGIRFVNRATSDAIRGANKQPSDSSNVEFAALGDYLLRYNTAIMAQRTAPKACEHCAPAS